jgi:hypothetical protein
MPGIDRAVRVASLAVAVLILGAVLRWTAVQHFPLWFDEAWYYNQVFDDRQAFLRGGPVATVKSLLFADPERPPAYRALVAPIGAVTQPSLPLLRAIALGFTIGALLLLWRACRAVAGPAASLLATVLLFSSPAILLAGSWFGTEYPLLLSIALLLYALIRRNPLGVAAAVALGLLSKSSFLLIGGPVMLAALLTVHDRRELRRLFLAGTGGVVFAAGWWSWHLGSALRFAQLGRTFERAAFTDPLSLATFGDKLGILATGLGAGLVIAAVLLAVGRIRIRLRQPRQPLPPDTRRAVILATATVVPLVALTLLSPVFVARHFAPALLGLALPLALLLDRARPAIRTTIAAAALLYAGWMAVTPATFLPRVERTDWARLRTVLPMPSPKIALIGGWPSLSAPEIRYGWTRDGRDAEVTWLWRSEERRLDWSAMMATALASDAVLIVPPTATTAPVLGATYTYELADNRHNAELIHRLETTGQFLAPVPFPISTDEKIDLLLYRHR